MTIPNQIPSITSCDLYNLVVLLRVDFNIPLQNGTIQDATRILKTLPTIKYLINANAKSVIISHLGRPKGCDDSLSLSIIVNTLSQLLNKNVKFINNCISQDVQRAVDNMAAGDVILLENLRFYQEEEQDNADFAQKLASIADIYVNDAFSCSHRAHASILSITKFLPSYAGLLMLDELKHLEQSVSLQARPTAVIVGGSKTLIKVKMLRKLVEKVDFLILGGAIANNFLLLNKINIGSSFFQDGIDSMLHSILEIAHKSNCKVIIPRDVLVAVNFNYNISILRDVESIRDGDVIADVGPHTIKIINDVITNSRTVLWSGPIGIFEYPRFANGTIELMNIINDLTHEEKLTSVIGGGDSLSAMKAAGLADTDFTYVSTGGGAFLSWLSGDKMPGVAALQGY